MATVVRTNATNFNMVNATATGTSPVAAGNATSIWPPDVSGYAAFVSRSLPQDLIMLADATVHLELDQTAPIPGSDNPQQVRIDVLVEQVDPFPAWNAVDPLLANNPMFWDVIENVDTQDFPNGIVPADTIDFTIPSDKMNAYVRRADWNDNIRALAFRVHTAPMPAAVPSDEAQVLIEFAGITLTTDELAMPFYQGLDTAEKLVSRVDTCPRCGRLVAREKWVKDGRMGFLVCSDCYDPPLPVPRQHGPPRQPVNDTN